jgi:PAS domain S-box-containing protein
MRPMRWTLSAGKNPRYKSKTRNPISCHGNIVKNKAMHWKEVCILNNIEILDLYRAIDESSIITFTDARGNITYANDQFCKISKYPKDELIGQNHRILKSGDHPREFFVDLWSTISSGKVWKGEIKNRAKDGTFYWVFTTIVPFLNEHGKPRQYVAVRTDITEMKRIKDEIVQLEIDSAKMAQTAAEDLLKIKTKFLDIAAHELRTPITVLSLILQLAERKMEKGKALPIDILKRLRAPIDHLTRLVVDLLDMSRLERGLLILIPALTDMVSLISGCLEEFRIQAPKRIFLFNKPDQPIEINVDPLRINQVLTNLLDNAVKYTSNGAIEVTIEDLPTVIRVSVIDHGAGIPKEQQSMLFEAFSRGSSDATVRASGLGLGLSISHGIMNLHSGIIGLVSKEGLGSTFYFDLPKKDIKT